MADGRSVCYSSSGPISAPPTAQVDRENTRGCRSLESRQVRNGAKQHLSGGAHDNRTNAIGCPCGRSESLQYVLASSSTKKQLTYSKLRMFRFISPFRLLEMSGISEDRRTIPLYGTNYQGLREVAGIGVWPCGDLAAQGKVHPFLANRTVTDEEAEKHKTF